MSRSWKGTPPVPSLVPSLVRRKFLGAAAAVAAAGVAGCKRGSDGEPSSQASTQASSTPPPVPSQGATSLRDLGKTGAKVEPVSLGGEGILRTTGRHREAVPMIEEAL